MFLFYLYIFFSHVTLFSMTKKLLHILRNKIKKRIMTIDQKTKMLFKVKKCPKNSKFLV